MYFWLLVVSLVRRVSFRVCTCSEHGYHMLPARTQFTRRVHIDSGVACPLWRGWQFLLRSFNWKSVSKEWPAWDALLWLGTLGLPIAKDRDNKLWVGCQLAIKFLVLCKTAKRLTRAIISRVYMVQYTWWFFNIFLSKIQFYEKIFVIIAKNALCPTNTSRGQYTVTYSWKMRTGKTARGMGRW